MKSLEVDGLVAMLLREGEVFLSQDHPLVEKQTTMQLFNCLCERLSDSNNDDDYDLNMSTLVGGWQLTAAV